MGPALFAHSRTLFLFLERSKMNRRFTRRRQIKPLIDSDNQSKIIEAILKGMTKTIESGVVEYRVGSRSLKRWTPGDISKLLDVMQELQYPPVAGRAIPTDH